MEGSKSESVFDSMDLPPQLFINTILNIVDDLVDDAFDFYGREASTFLKIDGGSDNSKARELSNGIERVHGMIQTVLDDSLEPWELYSLTNTFAVPEEFELLPETTNIDNDPRDIIDSSCDLELNEQLYSLRHKLDLAGKRSVELDSELKALERASISNQQNVLNNEALELYNNSSVDDMFKDMVKAASELRGGIDKLKTRKMRDVESGMVERLKNHGKEFYAVTSSDGMLEEGFGKFLGELRKM